MRILFFSAKVPHSRSKTAGQVEIYRYINGLVAKGLQVDLVSTSAPGEEVFFEEMRQICRRVYAVRRSVTYLQKAKQALDWLIHACRGPLEHRPAVIFVNNLIREGDYDIVQVEFAEAGRHIRRHGKTKLVLDAIDIEIKPALRRWQREKRMWPKLWGGVWYLYWRWKEPRIYRQYDMIFTRSDYDREYILRIESNLRVRVLPHLVPIEKSENDNEGGKEQNSIIFMGAFSRDVNIQSARFIVKQILPRLKKKLQVVKVYLVGSDPPQEFSEWAKQDTNIVVTGYVDDIYGYYKKAQVMVAPMFIGGGIMTKIIEAMASGLPVVTTAIGNEGVGAKDGEQILLAETAEEFAEKIHMLLQNDELRCKIGERAREFALNRFEFNKVIDMLEGYYRELLARGWR